MTTAADACALPPAGIAACEGIFDVPDPLPLKFGGVLERVRVAYSLMPADASDAPVVVALGGISAGRHVFSRERSGWWSGIVGPACALDSRRFTVLGIDYLGGSGDTTGPRPGETVFPSISAHDQATLIHRLIAHLGMPKLHAIVGASYGGMVALAFAEQYPDAVDRIVAISAAHRTHPMSTAWRSVQRAIVRFAAVRGEGAEGLKLARALAMATYRTPAEFAQRFAGEPERCATGFVFPVESYLFARGNDYAQRFVPEAFVCLSESIDLHRVRPERIRVPATLVGILEDQLVPIEDLRDLAGRLAGPCDLVEFSSLYGHDAFLKEIEALRPILARALEEDGTAPASCADAAGVAEESA